MDYVKHYRQKAKLNKYNGIQNQKKEYINLHVAQKFSELPKKDMPKPESKKEKDMIYKWVQEATIAWNDLNIPDVKFLAECKAENVWRMRHKPKKRKEKKKEKKGRKDK